MSKAMFILFSFIMIFSTGLFGQSAADSTNNLSLTNESVTNDLPVEETKLIGIYTETLPLFSVWGSNMTKEIWRGVSFDEDRRDTGEGTASWKLTSTGQTWLGMGIKFLPVKTTMNLSDYSNGSLNFMYKGTTGFKVGIKSGTNLEAWVSSSHMGDFGFTNDNEWHEIQVPLSVFTGISLTNISYPFMFASDSSRGMLPGTIYHIDNIYWNKYYTGPKTDRFVGTNFGIYSDTAETGISFDRDSVLDIWNDFHAGSKIVDLVKGTGEGLNAWKIIGTGRWAGFGIRPNPLRTFKDMSDYKKGSLHFMYKGTNAFKVGIKSAPMREFWISTSNMTKYGYIADETNWHEVIIPFSLCTNINFDKISQYFMWTIEDINYHKGAVYYLDGIYWSKIDPYAKKKAVAKPKKKKKVIK